MPPERRGAGLRPRSGETCPDTERTVSMTTTLERFTPWVREAPPRTDAALMWRLSGKSGLRESFAGQPGHQAGPARPARRGRRKAAWSRRCWPTSTGTRCSTGGSSSAVPGTAVVRPAGCATRTTAWRAAPIQRTPGVATRHCRNGWARSRWQRNPARRRCGAAVLRQPSLCARRKAGAEAPRDPGLPGVHPLRWAQSSRLFWGGAQDAGPAGQPEAQGGGGNAGAAADGGRRTAGGKAMMDYARRHIGKGTSPTTVSAGTAAASAGTLTGCASAVCSKVGCPRYAACTISIRHRCGWLELGAGGCNAPSPVRRGR